MSLLSCGVQIFKMVSAFVVQYIETKGIFALSSVPWGRGGGVQLAIVRKYRCTPSPPPPLASPSNLQAATDLLKLSVTHNVQLYTVYSNTMPSPGSRRIGGR